MIKNMYPLKRKEINFWNFPIKWKNFFDFKNQLFNKHKEQIIIFETIFSDTYYIFLSNYMIKILNDYNLLYKDKKSTIMDFFKGKIKKNKSEFGYFFMFWAQKEIKDNKQFFRYYKFRPYVVDQRNTKNKVWLNYNLWPHIAYFRFAIQIKYTNNIGEINLPPQSIINHFIYKNEKKIKKGKKW